MNAFYKLATLLLNNEEVEELNLFYQNDSLNSLLILSNDHGMQKESRYLLKTTQTTKSGFSSKLIF